MPRKYPYFPAYDGGEASELIRRCVDLCGRRYRTKCLGTYVNRDIRDKPGELSTHATGFACDLAYKDEAQARVIWDFFVLNSKALGVCAVHWYNYGRNKGLTGAAYRCNRGEGRAGVKVFKNNELGRGGAWLHIELEGDADEFEAAFRALKPA